MNKGKSTGANLGFGEKMWQAADKLRGHMDAAEYKHVVLGLVFLKYISDAFQDRYDVLKKERQLLLAMMSHCSSRFISSNCSLDISPLAKRRLSTSSGSSD